jgi:organic radical activating enzyme
MAERSSVYHYSEIFYSAQGEGRYTGCPTAWLRFFTCNLQCNGFGQDDPTDESTYDLPYQDVKVEDYKTLEELPVFEKGCDSSYSWSKKFKHLQRKGTADEIAQRLLDIIPFDDFANKDEMANQDIHLCFTGGEPMMKRSQQAVREILMSLRHFGRQPNNITFETNGTQPITEEFIEFFENRGLFPGKIFWSISPKLFSVSGEKNEKAIKPNVLKTYRMLSKYGQLKFVMNADPRCWEELDRVLPQFRNAGIDYPVWIMPVGATVEDQYKDAGEVANMALARGFNISARVHAYLWGNAIGV